MRFSTFCIGVAFAVAGALAGATVARAQTCGAAGGDDRPADKKTCGEAAADVASHPATGPGSATANSIDLVTGNKFLRESDSAWPDSLEFKRYYNSRNDFARSLGPGWSHSYDTVLTKGRARTAHPRGRNNEWEIQIIQADGRRLVFRGVRQPSSERRVLRFKAVDWSYGAVSELLDATPDRRFIWQWHDGRTLLFDDLGRLSAVEMPNGDRLALQYDGPGSQLGRVRSRGGLELAFEYYPAGVAGAQGAARAYPGRLAAVVEPDGRRITMKYDALGALTEVADAEGLRSTYHYDDSLHLHALTRVTDGLGRLLGEYRYEPQGRAVYSSKAAGVEAVSLSYTLPRRAGQPGQTIVASAAGEQTVFVWRYRTHTHQAQILSATGSRCAACPPSNLTRQYDRQDRLVSEVRRDSGERIAWQYDGAGRLASTRTGGSGAARRVDYRYAGPGFDAPVAAIRRPSVAPGREHLLLFKRDAQGRITQRIERGYAPDLGSLDRQLTPARWQPIERVISTAYVQSGAADGRVDSEQGPLPGGGDARRFDYDQHGWLAAVHYPEQLVERFEHDRWGRLARWVDSAGIESRISRAADGRTVTVERAGQISRVELRPNDRQILLSRDGSGSLRLDFDDALRMVGIRDANGRRLKAELDAEDRLARISVTSSDTEPPLIDFTPAELVRNTAVGSTDWSQGQAKVERRPDGRIVWTNPAGAATTWLRDDFGRLVAEASPERGVSVHRYDAAGRRIASATEAGVVALFGYDNLGRLLSQGTPAEPLSVQYRYRGALLLSVSDPAQTVAYQYDGQGRLAAEAVLLGPRSQGVAALELFVSAYHYDAFGRLVAQTLPNGHALGFGYGADGTVSAIAYRSRAGPASFIARDIQWLPFSAADRGLRRMTLGNGIDTDIGYDRLGRIERVSYRNTIRPPDARSDPSLHIELVRDEHGRITGVDRDGAQEAFVYDDRHRLVGAATRSGVEGYAYDLNGNRLVHVAWPAESAGAEGITKVAFEPARAPRLERYRYDRRGHLVRREVHKGAQPGATRASSDSVIDYSVSAFGAMLGRRERVSAELPPRAGPTRERLLIPNAGGRTVAAIEDRRLIARYVHNSEGNRVAKLVHGARPERSLFLYHGNRLQAEADGDGRLTAWYVHLGERPIAMLRFDERSQGEIFWLHGDHLGTPARVSDQRGRQRWRGRFSPFGARESTAGDVTMNLAFPGQYVDAESGLIDNHYRDYDPTSGRYLSADPIGPGGGTNLYAYAALDPVSRTDPRGLYESDIHYSMNLFLALAAGIDYQAARTIALATQYIDNNPDTRPLDPRSVPTILASALGNQQALLAYHFTLTDRDPASGALVTPTSARYANPVSFQLDNLLSAALGASTPCARFQFLGEYLHAFMDTFSHRNSVNRPYDPIVGTGGPFAEGAQSIGLGHGLDGHDPDYTFNHVRLIALPGSNGLINLFSQDWSVNEARTLEMEREVFDILKGYGDSAHAVSWDRIEPTLIRFNAIHESESTGVDPVVSFAGKLALLNNTLASLGYGVAQPGGSQRAIDLAGADRYSLTNAAANRSANLRDASGAALKPEDFPGTILPKPR